MVVLAYDVHDLVCEVESMMYPNRTTLNCPACGWPNLYHGKVPDSVRCGNCGEDVFADARMAEVDAMLRKMGQQRRDRAFLERWHE